MTDEVIRQQLVELQQARAALARQIDNSQDALKQIDEKISKLTEELNSESPKGSECIP